MNTPVVLEGYIWEGLEETSQPGVLSIITEIIQRDKHDLVEVFYSYMLKDKIASSFLSAKTVEERLKPGLQRWMQTLFCQSGKDDLDAALAMQRHVGEVHARAEIPVHVVAMGFRQLKRAIHLRILSSLIDREVMVNAVLRVDALMDVAFEEMSVAYVQSHEKGVRNEEAFRLHSAGHNLAAEREKQLGVLLLWENRLFRAIATNLPLGDISPLQSSTFGLWFRHKAPLLFDENRELPLVEECVTRVDDSLLPLIRLRAVNDGQSYDLQDILNNILTETEQIKFLINSMFDRLTDMEVGRDPLTQLFNRRFLPTIMKKEVDLSRRKGTSFALLMLDIDFFKKVNDTHGHESGDRVLQQVAALAINKTRAGDFIFRYGGEEFLLLLTEVDVNQAQEVADKIRQIIETADILLSGGKTLRVTVSIGVALSDDHPDYQRIIERADKALYTAKNTGRNRCVLAA